MAFRLINNRAQNIAVKGFCVTLILSVALHLFNVLSISITLPFILPWMLVWLIGYSMIKRNNDDGQ